MKKLLIYILLIVAFTNCGQTPNSSQNSNKINESQSTESTIIGRWFTKITQGNKYLEAYLDIKQNGTSKMWARASDGRTHSIDDIRWSKNGDILYVYKQGESEEVEEVKILSLDKNTLVLEYDDGERTYFVRK